MANVERHVNNALGSSHKIFIHVTPYTLYTRFYIILYMVLLKPITFEKGLWKPIALVKGLWQKVCGIMFFASRSGINSYYFASKIDTHFPLTYD